MQVGVQTHTPTLDGFFGGMEEPAIEMNGQQVPPGLQLSGDLDPAGVERIGVLADLLAVEHDRGDQIEPLKMEPRPPLERSGWRSEEPPVAPDALLHPSGSQTVGPDVGILDPPLLPRIHMDFAGDLGIHST